MIYPNSFAKLFEKPYRHRHILLVIKLSVLLHVFLSSADVKAVVYALFRDRISGKTVCEWSQKFPENIPNKKVKYRKGETVILFADEKYVWVKGVQAYWWSVKDHLGNVLATMITTARDSASAELLFRRAKAKIIGQVRAVVHDGLKSYDKPVRKVFGRNCQSIVAGITGKFVMINKCLYWITNNSAESLNAQIDAYYTRVHYNFNNIDSANRFADMFLYRMHLRNACDQV